MFASIKFTLEKSGKTPVTYFFPLVEFSLYLQSFSTSRKNQLNWTLPTLLQSSGLLSIVMLVEIFFFFKKKAR